MYDVQQLKYLEHRIALRTGGCRDQHPHDRPGLFFQWNRTYQNQLLGDWVSRMGGCDQINLGPSSGIYNSSGTSNSRLGSGKRLASRTRSRVTTFLLFLSPLQLTSRTPCCFDLELRSLLIITPNASHRQSSLVTEAQPSHEAERN